MFLSGMAMFNHLLKMRLKGTDFNFFFINLYLVTYHMKGVLPRKIVTIGKDFYDTGPTCPKRRPDKIYHKFVQL